MYMSTSLQRQTIVICLDLQSANQILFKSGLKKTRIIYNGFASADSHEESCECGVPTSFNMDGTPQECKDL